jgi:hypothetical protein
MVTITAADFKDKFDRGQWTYGDDLPAVRDKDIDEAISEAEAVFNHDLYPTEIVEENALLYLTAHFLQNDLDMFESGGQPKYAQSSRAADGVSESLSIPDWMLQDTFAMFATTGYGQKYLLLSKPYLDGAVFVVSGATLP